MDSLKQNDPADLDYKQLTMTKICNLLKLFWEPGPQWYLRRSYQLLSAQPVAPWLWSVSNPSPSAHPTAALESIHVFPASN